MAALTAVNLALVGTASNPQAVTASDTVSANDAAAGAVLEVKNGSGGALTVTVVDPGHTAAGNATVSPQTVGVTTIADGATKRIGLKFAAPAFVSSSTNRITITYSATTLTTYELYI